MACLGGSLKLQRLLPEISHSTMTLDPASLSEYEIRM